MGVRSLWKILKASAEATTPSDMRLAVDANIWVHQYRGLRKDEVVYFFSKRILKLLHHGIQPIFVFDGKTPELKRRTVELRRAAQRGASTCNMCSMCSNVKECTHSEDAKKELLDRMDADVMEQMRNHRYNWGHSLDEESSGEQGADGSLRSLGVFADMDFVVSKSLSRSQKLKRLVGMRERRKDRARYNAKSMEQFSALQIENVKRRNLISHNIRVLENSFHRRVQNDCSTTYRLVKQQKLLTEDDLVCRTPASENPCAEESSSECDAENELRSYPVLAGILEKHRAQEAIPNDAGPVDERRLQKSSVERRMGGFFAEEGRTVSVAEIEDLFSEEKGVSSRETKEEQERIEHEDGRMLLNQMDGGGSEVDHVTRQMKTVLDRFGIPHMNAPMEADAQCGFLCESGVVDGVVTEDNDVLLYGGVVFKNVFRRNRQIERYSLEGIQKCLGLGRSDLIRLSYLLGSDYTPGIRGVGPVRAMESIRRGDVDEKEIAVLVKTYTHPVVEKITTFDSPEVCRQRLERFFEESCMGSERMEELLFFADRIQK